MQISLNTPSVRNYLKNSDFKSLFIKELGWDRHETDLTVPVDGKSYTLNAVAQKRGMTVFVYSTQHKLPEYPERRKIERQAAKSAHEHIIIFTDGDLQIWQWVKREPGKPTACREHQFHRSQSGEALIQKLGNIAFGLDEEEQLTLVDVTSRTRTGFDVEKITKKFYDRFKDEHASFLKFLKGIPDDEMKRWYASVMINRLMFIYFIQKKGFLHNDRDYLRNKLKESKQREKDAYYKDFLCPLFFEGFAKKESERSSAMNILLGSVPYLNGGLFLKHQIEEAHGKTIAIADAAFQKLFDFFDQYNWHLDERPLRQDNEINPDVLGYIFEKYINQKQMGAYYTKEDITEYISKNTILPFLFDEAKKKCKIAFEGEHSIWKLLQADPDRYIYDAIKKGVDKTLPADIAAGIKDVSKRTNWNKSAAEEFALPTEIWREVVARRKRYEEVHAKLSNGEIREINDFITYNLNIRQFVQDVIETCEGPELLRAFWHAIVGRVPEKSNEKFEQGITILDPTCGSGAFLFAALNILEPLYEACLDRMEVFVSEHDRGRDGANSPDLQVGGNKQKKDAGFSPTSKHDQKYADFRKILQRIEDHPNRRYFVFKSIIINNLYGVDIMEEATEICKLRLFLKLVAQIDEAKQIEPLPDIDFNIRAGNTLVGFATYAEAERAVTSKLDFGDTMTKIKEAAEDLDHLFQLFRQQQTELGGTVTAKDKAKLQEGLKKLEDELNGYLADEYGVGTKKGPTYDAWLKSHQPFHWFVEFYGIISNGGFDAIIGNPPFVEYSKIKTDYSVSGYLSEPCSNLFAFSIERSISLLQANGRFSMITPLSIVSTERMEELRRILFSKNRLVFVSNYSGDAHPSVLFNGVKMRLSIVITSPLFDDQKRARLITTSFTRWLAEARNDLFQTLEYSVSDNEFILNGLIPKIGADLEKGILVKINQQKKSLGSFVIETHRNSIYAHRIVAHFVKCMDHPPYFRNDRDGEKKSEDYKVFSFSSKEQATHSSALLNSNTFYYFYLLYSDAYHCGRELILSFPCNLSSFQSTVGDELAKLNKRLMVDLKKNSMRRRIKYHGTGWIEYDEFYPRLSKPIIDEIDRVLAQHYGFTEEELDFIINYDIKYRMGKENAEEEE